MPLFEPYKPPAPDPIPIIGDPPFGQAVLEELVRTISQSNRKCDHTLKQVKEFLQAKNLEVEPVFRWLKTCDVFCDCAFLNYFINNFDFINNSKNHENK